MKAVLVIWLLVATSSFLVNAEQSETSEISEIKEIEPEEIEEDGEKSENKEHSKRSIPYTAYLGNGMGYGSSYMSPGVSNYFPPSGAYQSAAGYGQGYTGAVPSAALSYAGLPQHYQQAFSHLQHSHSLPQQFATQPFSQHYAPQQFSQFSPQQFSMQQYSPQHFASQQFSAPFSTPQLSQQLSLQQFNPQQFSSQQFSPQISFQNQALLRQLVAPQFPSISSQNNRFTPSTSFPQSFSSSPTYSTTSSPLYSSTSAPTYSSYSYPRTFSTGRAQQVGIHMKYEDHSPKPYYSSSADDDLRPRYPIPRPYTPTSSRNRLVSEDPAVKYSSKELPFKSSYTSGADNSGSSQSYAPKPTASTDYTSQSYSPNKATSSSDYSSNSNGSDKNSVSENAAISPTASITNDISNSQNARPKKSYVKIHFGNTKIEY